MVGMTSSGSLTGASGTKQTPSEKSFNSAFATASPSRVLPTPPVPISVSKRTSGCRNRVQSSTSSSSRPKKGSKLPRQIVCLVCLCTFGILCQCFLCRKRNVLLLHYSWPFAVSRRVFLVRPSQLQKRVAHEAHEKEALLDCIAPTIFSSL